jgi:hypothetical protein
MGYFLSIFTDRFSGAVVHLTTDNGSPLSFESMTNLLSPTIQSFKQAFFKKTTCPHQLSDTGIYVLNRQAKFICAGQAFQSARDNEPHRYASSKLADFYDD